MNEIEKILKDNMEDYESVKRQALKFIHENKKELSKNYAYAEVCGNPVDASCFFFLIDEKKPGSDLLLEMLDYALKNYVSSEKASVTACIKGGFHLVKKTGVDYVKEESREYLEALSQAGYIIGNMVLPGSFVKKEAQVYFNPMLEIYDRKSVETAEFLSVTARELLKTDYIYAPSKSKAKEAWLEKCTLGKVYDGKVIIEKKEGLKEGRGSLLECIRRQNAVPGMEFFSLRNQEERKKVLILSSWKAEREAKLVVRKLADSMDREKYDTVIYSGWLGSKGDVKEFLAFEKELPMFQNKNKKVFGMPNLPELKIDKVFCEEDVFRLGLLSLSVFYTPGHTQGSVCLYSEKDSFLFSGDTLFYETVGRCDNEQCLKQLTSAVQEKLFCLPDDTMVFPGHGESTTIGHEKLVNPYLNGELNG